MKATLIAALAIASAPAHAAPGGYGSVILARHLAPHMTEIQAWMCCLPFLLGLAMAIGVGVMTRRQAA